MASMFRSGSSRRKAEAPGKIRIQLKGKNSKVLNSEDEDEIVGDDADAMDLDNGIPEDLPEGTIVVQPQAVEDAPVKKKREPPVRIDTSVLDSVSCTACGRQLNPYKSGALQKHPELKVVICRRCEKFLSSGDIAKDKDGTDEQCRWCGEGGRLVVCDECASAFCKTCVMRNFNRSEFNSINGQQKWRCYLCNKAPLQGLRENYRKIRDTLKALHLRDKAKAAAAAAPTSNGTQSSEKSAGTKQVSGGSATASARKGRGVQDTVSTSTQRSNSSSASSKSNSESSQSLSGKEKNVKAIETGDFTLRLEDINVSHEKVDTVMDNLSTATNTFKEMLRALRSQFHATSPRGSDEAPPMFQFSLSSMNVQEKKRRCAKALNMGLETYIKSIKTILTGNGETGSRKDDKTGTKETEGNRENKKDKEPVLLSTASKQSKSTTKTKEINTNGVVDSSSATSRTKRQASSEQNLKNKAKSTDYHSSSEESTEDTPRDKPSKKKMEKTKESEKVINDSKSAKTLAKDSDECDEAENKSQSSASAEVAKSSSKVDSGSQKVTANSQGRKTDKESASSAVSRKNKMTTKDSSITEGEDLAGLNPENTEDKSSPSSNSVTAESEKAVHSKETVNKKAKIGDIDEGVHKNSSQEKENAATSDEEPEETTGVDSNEKDSQVNELEDEQTENDKTNSKEKSGLKSPKRKKSHQTEDGEPGLGNTSGDTYTEEPITENKKEKASCKDNTSEDYENLAAKFDLIKELAYEMLKHDEEDNKDGNDGEEDDISVDQGKTSDNTKSASGPKSSIQGKSKRKKDDLSSDSDRSDIVKTKKPKKVSSSGKSKSPLAEQKKAKNTDDGAISSDVSSSDLLMSDDSDGNTAVRRQRKKRKEMPKAESSTKPAKQKTEVVKKEAKPQANGKPKSKSSSSDVKVNGKDADVDELDREIDKLSKMPTIRKRKAMNPESETNPEEDEVKEKPKGTNQAAKKSKPGPKCSKKARDYDGLSSEDDVNKESEHDDDDDNDDDEDLPPVQFFIEDPQSQDVENMEDDENEMAKNGLLEDLKEEEDDDDDDSSSEEDSDSPKKTKSKKKDTKKSLKKDIKQEEQEEEEKEEADSDDNIGKRKQIHSKLLDTKLSDSDSDITKPKKKKKDSDEASFKDKDSSGSSIESDLTDDDDEDEENEDSEDLGDDDDESKPKKKGKKKGKRRRKRKNKKGSDDDDNDEEEGSDGGKKKKKGKGKRRRRIKKMSNSSDEEGEGKGDDDDDDDDPNSSKAGKRKQIRKVMSNKKLEDSTKAAAKAEEKRRKRIAAKQREFNIETITDENNPMNCPITTKLILEPGKEEGDDPVIQVNKSLIRKLKPHQVEAVQFMWDCMYESVKRSRKEQGAGCILAHCMGLGKTLSVVSFVHTILTHEKVLKHRTCLVVSPLNTVLNWKNEWTMWLEEEDQLEVWELASCKQNPARADALKDWHESGGIMIMGYEMYRNLTTGNRCKNKRQKKVFLETLVDPGPDLVICDEGHILKNEASAISKAMNTMKTRRRVVLTGTPLQNNLNEYHCMLSFVKPNLLGTRKEFTNRFISPIQNGQCTDSTPRDVKLMKARAHVLHEMLAGCVQRRDYSALTKFLPPKQEYVISVRLTNIQIELYEKYLELTGQGVDGIFTNKGARLFTDYQNLMKIWTHPWVLKLAEIRDEMKMKYDDEDSFIDDDESEVERSFSSSSSSSDEEKAVSDSGGEGTSAGPSAKRGTRRTRAKARRQAGEDSDPEEVIAEWKSKTRTGKGDEDVTMEDVDRSVTKEWWAPYVTEDDKLKLELSNKLVLLFEILRMCEEIGDKVLIFSQSILSLNIIESFLEVIDSKFQQECENATEEEKEDEQEAFGKSWTKNLDYYRMDGSTSAQNRQMWAANFNDLENYRARLFLISTRAGGLGINLVAANRVIIFDASWNPSHDVQSIFRVYRFGQTKPCYIYRFLAQGTMEEKIYERQVTKLSLSQRVVDEHQIERHFSANDLKELYNFRADKWDDGTEKPTLALPKDPLLAEILTNNKHCVVSFHEHDSLLENQVEQTLTEEEKKAAWEEYENEKKGIIMRGPGMERTASWPMMAAAQILSREQITATVQALRQQLPDISEDLFHMHVQQALRRQVQMKQEEMRRMELLRLQEMNYLNMIKQQAEQSGLSHAQSLQAMQNMAPWMQMQRLRAMQNNMMMQQNMHPSSSMSLLGQALSNPVSAERLSNKPEEAIDLEDN